MSSGDMLVILVLPSIHHTKSEMCGAFRALAERPRAHTTTLRLRGSWGSNRWPSPASLNWIHLIKDEAYYA